MNVIVSWRPLNGHSPHDFRNDYVSGYDVDCQSHSLQGFLIHFGPGFLIHFCSGYQTCFWPGYRIYSGQGCQNDYAWECRIYCCEPGCQICF